MKGVSHGDGKLQPAWVTEQISLFVAAIGLRVRFAPMGPDEANHLDDSSEFCSIFQSEDGQNQVECETWHVCQTQMIMRSPRAAWLRCPMKLDYLWAPVSKEGAFYGFLHGGPVLLDGHADGKERGREVRRLLGNGSQDSPEFTSRQMAQLRDIPRVKAARSDGLLFLLELMGQRLAARFHQESRVPVPFDSHEALVRRAEAVLCVHFHEKISTRDIADRLHVSESHLCHAFREVTGGTVLQHLNELRFKEACRLLKEHPRLTVGEVAFAAGFQSLSRFSEQFRRRKMPSPGKWRQVGE